METDEFILACKCIYNFSRMQSYCVLNFYNYPNYVLFSLIYLVEMQVFICSLPMG
uniref:Uncharacterized protein MANES_01G166500 n=1 Tax=Rhizophora mucronata TaxID=61149 RepID=A0A2P2JL01_RHIMU